MRQPLLSILIPTIPGRETMVHELIDELKRQREPFGSRVEILLLETPLYAHGGPSLGAKRNECVRDAKGKYVVHIDDDDWVAPDYVEKIVAACLLGKSAVSIRGKYIKDGVFQQEFVHSIVYKGWFEEGGVLLRPVNHLNPILREIALEIPFRDLSWAEDVEWSKDLMASGLLVSEAQTEDALYEYRFSSTKRWE